jgi:nucleoside phosphorylase
MRRAILLGLLLLLPACGDDGGDTQPIAVLAAFPAELAAVLAHTEVSETLTIDGRIVRRGTIAGRPVVVAMTGIGLVNAERTTRTVLEHFAVRGVVMSGVAGSPLRIADVTVAATWTLPDDGAYYPVHPPWLALARRLAERGAVEFERCTTVPDITPDLVCMAHVPDLYVGGIGESDDSFTGAFPCRPGSGDVFGCDVDEPPRSAATRARLSAELSPIQDMESAAVAREAAAHGLPFIAFRGVSDGNGDPLGLPPFPQQFFAYYPIAADNAAAATAAFVARL